MNTPFPPDEAARLQALRRFDVLDSPHEAAFERITTMAARIFGVPTVLISLVDEERQWLKSAFGCDLSETARDIAFCAHAILQDDVMVVPDAMQDARFAQNPLVVGAPFVRFYAGAPLVTRDGFKLGTLCLLDTKTRDLGADERATLADLASVVVDELELRLAMKESQKEIDERRRAEDAARQSEAHFRALTENAMDIITILDRNGVILYESPALERLFGFTPEELIGRNAFEFVHPDDAERVLERFQQRASGGAATGDLIEFRYQHKDGSWRTLEAAASISIEGPDAEGIVINSRDVSERRRGEEALRESEARKSAILETALDCIITIDDVGIVSEWNPAAERTFNFKRDEAIGRELAELIIPPQFRDLYRQGTSNYLSAGEWPTLNRRLQLPAQRADGSALSIEMAVTRIPLEGRAVYTAHIRDVSEQRQAERLLVESEERYKSLFDYNVDATISLDAQGRFLDANLATESATGYCAKDIIGQSFLPLVAEDNVRRVQEEFEAAVGGKSVRTEFGVIHKDGHRVEMQATAVPIVVNDAIVGVYVIARDVSERKRTDDRLRMLESAVVNANDAILITEAEPIDLPGPRILYANAAYERMTGYTIEELLGTTPRKLQGPGTDRAPREKIRAALKKWQPVEVELINYRKDGSEFWVELSIVPVADETGWFTHWVSIQRDITERKRTEERLRLLESVVVTANDAVLITEAEPIDLPGPRILYVNEAFTRITGYSLEEVIGQTPRLLQGPDTARESCEKIRQALEKWQPVEVELLNYRKDGSEFWVELSIVPVANEKGWFTHWVSVQRDIDGRKKAERELEEARDEAQRANLAKSEFLSRMSHELRTPLNAILGFGQLLEEDIVDDDSAESVEQIMRAGRHLLDLINEVLDIARIESGRLELSPEPVDLDELLRETLELARPLANQANVSMEVLDEERERWVLGDRQRLKQVLINLLSNAVKYNRPGGSVQMRFSSNENGRLTLAIRDSGFGIAPDRMARLFLPFERLGAEHGEVEGTGLGLALSKRLIEALGGRILVDSVPGEGTTFSIQLPCASSPLLALPSMNEDEAVAFPPVFGAKTVLYIEDNAPNLRLIERILERSPDVQLLSARSGQEGLELARAQRPDFILLDFHLPDLPGDEVLRQLRADDLTNGIPVALLSADATPNRVERLLASGAVAYLTKPLDVSHLMKVLEDNMAVAPATPCHAA